MIQALIRIAVEQLRSALAARPGAPPVQIVAGPVEPPAAGDLPQIVLTGGPFTFNQKAKDLGAGQPRPQPFRQRIALDGQQPGGPYKLDRRPLRGCTRGTLILDPGAPTESRQDLVEGRGLEVDLGQGTVRLLDSIAARPAESPAASPDGTAKRRRKTAPAPASASPGVLLVEYLVPGISGACEFRQTLLLDAFAADAADAEAWASLCAGVLLTRADALLAAASAAYDAGDAVRTAHRCERLELIEGRPGAAPSPAALQLTFSITGLFRVSRPLAEVPGVIEQILSPGEDATTPVALRADLA